MKDSSKDSITAHLEKLFERRYVEAKKSAVASQTRIPPWVFLLLLILGWNEIMTILTTPLYLFFAIVILGAIACVKIFHLGPMLDMGWKFAMNLVSTTNGTNSSDEEYRRLKRSHQKDD